MAGDPTEGMGAGPGTVRAAVVQAAPVMFDTPRTLQKLADLTADAAGRGSKLIVFPEAFVGGYPKGHDFGVVVGMRSPEGRDDFRRYFEAAVEVPGEATWASQDLAIAEAQLRDYQARLGQPFAHDGYLVELTDLRDQLKSGLSSTPHDPGHGTGPSVSELAERIKALKATSNVETTPQRARENPSTAEEPITARIRRRQGATTASDPTRKADAASEALTVQPPEPSQDSFITPSLTFRERIALERQSKDREPNL